MLAGARRNLPGLKLVADESGRIVLAHQKPFCLGAAEIRPATREILFDGRVTIVEPKVMQLLVALHRAGGGVVSKDDLVTLCWNRRVVGEDAINRVASRLRVVAAKAAGDQFRIETITKVGYRLVAGSSGDSHEHAPNRDALPSFGRRQFIAAGGALATVAAAAGLLAWRAGRTPAEARLLIDNARAALREGNANDAGNSIATLKKAVEIAPGSAEAWGMLAFAYIVAARSAPASERADLTMRSRSAAQRALQLRPHQADAEVATILTMRQFRNWYAYETACRSALQRHPDHPVLKCTLAYTLAQVGRTAESLPLNEDGLRSFPLSPGLHVIKAFNLWDLGRLEEAEAAIEKAFGLFPRYYGLWFVRLYFLMYNGRAGEAAAMIADKDSRPAGIPDWNYDLTATQVNALASGDRAQIARTIDLWKTESLRGTGFVENAAIFAGFAGDMDEAFRLLNGLYFNRGIRMPDTYFSKEQGNYAGPERHTFILFRRPIARIRDDARFGALTRELGLDDYSDRTGSRALVIG